MNFKKFLLQILCSLVKFNHVDIEYSLKYHSDIRDGVEELIQLAPNNITDEKNDGLRLHANGVAVLIHKDSKVQDIVDEYHKALKKILKGELGNNHENSLE